MDLQKRVEEWAKKMGYKGKVPDAFRQISGPATAHIWEQLITKVKPKEEIEHIRKNITINSLKTIAEQPQASGTSQSSSRYIEMYNRRKRLMERKKQLENDISEMSQENTRIEVEIKSDQIKLEKIKQEKRTNKQKKFLYKKKKIDLQNKIKDIEEKLQSERDINSSKCTDKEEILKIVTKNVNDYKPEFEDVNEPEFEVSSILSKGEATHKSDGSASYTGTIPKSTRHMSKFGTSSILSKSKTAHTKGGIVSYSGNPTIKINDLTLPDVSSNLSKSETPKVEQSVPYTGTIPKNTSYKSKLDASLMLSKSQTALTKGGIVPYSELNDSTFVVKPKVLEDEELRKRAEDIFAKYDFNVTLSILLDLIEKTQMNLLASLGNNICCERPEVPQDHPAYFLKGEIVKCSLLNMKVEKMICIANKLYENLLQSLYNKLDNSQLTQLKPFIELKLEEISIQTKLNFMKRELFHPVEDSFDTQQREIANLETLKLQEELKNCNKQIARLLHYNTELIRYVNHSAHEMNCLVANIRQLVNNMSWLQPLMKNVNKREIETFCRYDLDFNRKVELGGNVVHVRDLLNYGLGEIKCLNVTSPEVFITEIIRKVIRVEEYTKALGGVEKLQFQKYSLKELKENMDNVDQQIKKLELVHKETTVTLPSVSQSAANFERMLKFWLDVPVEAFVGKEILFNEENYLHYKKIFDSFYKNL